MNVEARIQRLQELIMRLSQEDACWKDDIYPLHHMERNAYLRVGNGSQALEPKRWRYSMRPECRPSSRA